MELCNTKKYMKECIEGSYFCHWVLTSKKLLQKKKYLIHTPCTPHPPSKNTTKIFIQVCLKLAWYSSDQCRHRWEITIKLWTLFLFLSTPYGYDCLQCLSHYCALLCRRNQLLIIYFLICFFCFSLAAKRNKVIGQQAQLPPLPGRTDPDQLSEHRRLPWDDQPCYQGCKRWEWNSVMILIILLWDVSLEWDSVQSTLIYYPNFRPGNLKTRVIAF